MALRDWVMPDEVQSASRAGADLISVVSKTSHFWLKHCVALGAPFAVGALAAYAFVRWGMKPQANIKDVLAAVLTFSAVIAGFIVTLMLFTGRISGTESLKIDAAREFVAKLTYLLFSQALTLIVSLACGLLSIGWLLCSATNAPQLASDIILIATFGMLALTATRTLILPFQIYELHQFSLATLVEEKQMEFDREIDEARKELRGSQERSATNPP